MKNHSKTDKTLLFSNKIILVLLVLIVLLPLLYILLASFLDPNVL
ncbi:ABC transporter permease, partial [Niallia nealsonii AAU1]